MKNLTTLIALLAATAGTTPIPSDTLSTNFETHNTHYTTVCPYKFCFSIFGYECNDDGDMTKEESFEGCNVGCYCRKRSNVEESGLFFEEQLETDFEEEFEGSYFNDED